MFLHICLVLAAPIIDFTMEGSPHSVLKVYGCATFRGIYVSVSTSTPTTFQFIGFGYFCIAAVVTVSHGWSKGVLRSPDLHGVGQPRCPQIGSSFCTGMKQISKIHLLGKKGIKYDMLPLYIILIMYIACIL